jgi:hypothetical protein
MPQQRQISALHLLEVPTAHSEDFSHPNPRQARAPVDSTGRETHRYPLLTVEDVARRLNVSRDWVWDHSTQGPTSPGDPNGRRHASVPIERDRSVHQRKGTPLCSTDATPVE